jgi:N-acetylated-alpha-linked acidic dipeptidase
VNLHNEVEYVITPQWNVIGKIPGYIPDETVIIGNHRDAWIAGGAADPNSGSAALLEVARSFGKMIGLGWKPARTILLASWDGEEYGLLGSTEWVEDHQKKLHGHALAYLNVDVGARSPVFSVSANPLLRDLIYNATKKVMDPKSAEQGRFDDSVYDVWDKEVKSLGSGSDYTAFQDHLGIPSVDMGFGGYEKDGPAYHYHSNYDSFHWMENFGDKGFKYHVAIAKIWGLMALQLAETPIVSFNATAYADSLAWYARQSIEQLNLNITALPDHPEHPPHHPGHPPHHHPEHPHPPPHDPEHPPHHHPNHTSHHPSHPHPTQTHPHCPHHTHPHPPHDSNPCGPPPTYPCAHPPPDANPDAEVCQLSYSLEQFVSAAQGFEAYASHLRYELSQEIPWWNWWKRVALWLAARGVNQKYKYLDRTFLYPGGLDDREWFKHVAYAPGKWTGELHTSSGGGFYR